MRILVSREGPECSWAEERSTRRGRSEVRDRKTDWVGTVRQRVESRTHDGKRDGPHTKEVMCLPNGGEK